MFFLSDFFVDCFERIEIYNIYLRPAACPQDPEIQAQSEIPRSRIQAAGRGRVQKFFGATLPVKEQK